MGQAASLKRTFGRRVQEWRRRRGLTQDQLARTIRVEAKHLGAVERGVKAPSFDLIERVARALNVEPYSLFLPAEVSKSDVDQDIRVVVQELGRTRRTRLHVFFNEMLRTIKRLDAEMDKTQR